MRQQLTDLRRVMEAAGVDACLVPTTDFHGSEYVNDYFKCREFFIGVYRFCRDSGGDERRRRPLDRRKIFYTGGSPIGRKRNPSDENESAGRTGHHRIFEKKSVL